MKTHIMMGLVSAAALWAGSASTACAADAVAAFYKDKTVTVVSAGGAGGAHGAYAQMISVRIGKHIPGHPTVIVQYMPGAGGNKAMNYLYNVTAQDGTNLGVPLQDLVFNARIGIKAVKYDASKARYLGGVDTTRTTVTVMKSSGVLSLDDAKKKEVLMASAGRGGQTYIIPMVLNTLLGTKFRIVSGYRGLGLMHLAMEKGEVHGRAASWSSIAGTKQGWVKKGLIANLVTIGLDREPELPDVPTLGELVTSEKDHTLIRFLAGSAALGRAWLGFGAIPADRLAALRAAYAEAIAEPGFKLEAAKRGLPVRPVAWQDQQKIVKAILAAPDDTVARVKAFLGPKKKKQK